MNNLTFAEELRNSTKTLIEQYFDIEIVEPYSIPGRIVEFSLDFADDVYSRSMFFDFSRAQNGSVYIVTSDRTTEMNIEVADPEFEKKVIFAVSKAVVNFYEARRKRLRKDLEHTNHIITQAYGATKETDWKQ